MTEREFFNLFQFADGFEQTSLATTNSGNLMGFARFNTVEQAEQCAAYLNGRVVDPASGAVIKCVMAQKNLKPSNRPPVAKRPFGDICASLPVPKTARTSAPTASYSAQDLYQALLAFQSIQQGGLAQPLSSAPAVAQPCDTLYVAGLPSNITEEELRTYATSFLGFKDLRLVNNGQKCFALVQFDTDALASQAMSQMGLYPLRGQVLHLQFSKSPLGVPKHFKS
eukprot:GGOE01049230.1.p1 GENE.GGOE01049230.1~~GGOE01049230.1.p1  ORF type:complete len:255 (+),score=33.95 GGOE01049230.1:93-767(+)